MINFYRCLSVSEDLKGLNAPPRIMEAGREIDEHLAAKRLPPAQLVEFVRTWVGKLNQQDRYGR